MQLICPIDGFRGIGSSFSDSLSLLLLEININIIIKIIEIMNITPITIAKISSFF